MVGENSSIIFERFRRLRFRILDEIEIKMCCIIRFKALKLIVFKVDTMVKVNGF